MKKLLPAFTCLSLFLSLSSQATTTNTAKASGTWELIANWSAGHVPLASEDVVIPGGFNMTINAADVCASLTIGDATSAAASVTVVLGNSLTLTKAGGGTGNLTINPSNLAFAYTLAGATGTITIPGIVISGGNKGGLISVSTGTISFSNAGAWNWADGVNVSVTGTGTATIAGALTMNSANTTTFLMSAAGHLTFTGLLTQNSNNYTITNTTTAGILSFNGGYTLNAGTFTTMAAETINFGGPFTNSGSAALILNATSTAIFTGSPTITPTSPITFGNLQINAGATVTLAGNILFAGATWTNNGGTLTPSGNSVTFTGANNQTINGTATTQTFYDIVLNLSAGKALTGGGSTNTLVVNNFTETTGNYTPGTLTTLTINGNCVLSAGTFSTIAAETITLGGTFSQAAALTFNPTSTVIFTAAATLTPSPTLIFGNIQINATATVSLAGNISVAGSTWTNNGGAFTPSTFTVTFNGTASQSITGSAASQTFYNLVLNLTAGQALTGAGSLTNLVVNNFTETTGNFLPGTITSLSINGNCILTAGAFSGAAGETINFAGNLNIGAAQTLNPACTAIFTTTSTITPGAFALTFGNVQINSGATLTLAGNILVAGATWTNNSGTFTPGLFKVTFNGASGQTIGGTLASQTFYDVTANLTAGQTLSTTGSTTALVFNNYTQTAGNFNASGLTTLTLNASCLLTAGTFTAPTTINVVGNWTNNGGTFSPGTGLVNFQGIANEAITGTAVSQTFNDISLNLTAGKALSIGGSTTTFSVNNFTETTGNFTSGTASTLNIAANWMVSAGVFSTNALETVNFAGALTNAVAVTFNATSTEIFTSSSTITTTAALTLGIAQINLGSTVILAGNILVAGATWTNNGGTFTPATYSVTFNCANNQTITGTIATPTFYDVVVNLAAGKTLTCAGSATSLVVNNFTETTGNFNPGTATTVTINGNLILTAGTFTAPPTLNALGNWTVNAGIFIAGTGIVNFTGVAAQAINGTAATQTFYDVVETLPAGLALSATTTTLNMNNFTETTGNFSAGGVTTFNINSNLTISAGTFTGAQTGAANTNLTGNVTNGGAYSCTGSLMFVGVASPVVSGAGTWTLGGTGMNKTLKTTIIDIQLPAFIAGMNAGGGGFTFTTGTWKFNTSAATYTDIHNKGTTTALTIGPNAVLEVDQGTVNLCANGTSNNVLLEGMLNMLGGTINVQQGQALNTGYDLRYKVVGGVTPQFYITTGATLNLGAGFNPTAPTDYLDFNMTGGTFNMCTNGYSRASTLLFNDVVGGKTVMTAGTIIMQDACNAAATDLDMGNGNINPYTVTGGTIQFGNASTPAGATFYAITPNALTTYPNITTAGPVAKNIKAWSAGQINLFSLDISSNLTFDISGFNNNINFTGSNGTFTLNHSGNFIIGTGTFIFSGTSAQVITGTVPRIFGNIVINNTGGGVSLGVAETMTGTLTLTNGILTTLPNNTLTITAAGGATAGSATSFVDGPLAKIGNTPFVFPLGNGTKYARLGISAPSVSTTMTGQYFHTGYPNYPGNLPLNAISGYEYWTLGEAAVSTMNVTLYWEDSAASGITTYDNSIRVIHFNGASWDDKGQTALSTSGITGNVTSIAVSNFSPFTFGSTNGAVNPLPVELLSFNAKADAKKEVDVTWATATETNCDYYTVERSKDGLAFELLTKKKGAGNSSSILNYKTIDTNPYAGLSYYRLTQTDFNGTSKTYNPIAVNFEGDKSFAVFPNPNTSNSPLYMKIGGEVAGEEVLVVLYSEMGLELYSKLFISSGDGLTNIGDAIGSSIPPGIYFISATSQNGIYKQKLLIK